MNAAPSSIPLSTDQVVQARMVTLRKKLADTRGRAVAWWEVLQELLDTYDSTREGQ